MSARTTRSQSQRNLNASVDCKSVKPKQPSVTNKRRQPKVDTTSVENSAQNSNGNSSDNELNAENVNVTPPKQRKACSKQNALSPSTLLHRLSLAGDKEQNENQSNVINVSERPKSKIDNARKVLTTGETEELYGREKELTELSAFLTTNGTNKTSASIYISGQPGTGKTACVRKLLISPVSKQFQKVYINCTKLQTPTAVYRAICNELNIKLMAEKNANLKNIHNYICHKNNKMVLLVLDEIDELIEKKQSVLYTIFEWPTLPKAKIILIGIANSLDLTNRALKRLQTQSIAEKPQLMHFSPYTREQIIDIFKNRLEAAGVLDVFPAHTLHLLSAKVAAMSGDIRKALDLGRRVAEKANEQTVINAKTFADLGIDEIDKPEKIDVNQVLTVLNDAYSTANKWDDESSEAIPLQEKVLVCTLLLLLKRAKNKDITVGRLRDVYAKVCSKRGIPSLDETEFFGICSLTETKGILRMIKNKVSRLTKIQLQWDEEEITNIIRDKQLISNILLDISVLDK